MTPIHSTLRYCSKIISHNFDFVSHKGQIIQVSNVKNQNQIHPAALKVDSKCQI
jgi:hypothetical protein